MTLRSSMLVQPRSGFLLRYLLFCFLGLLLPSLAAAQQPLNTMVLTGAISPSSDGKIVPTDGDVVLAVNANTGNVEGSGPADSVAYGIILTDKPSSLNGVQLLLRLRHGGVTYKLLRLDGSEAIVAFNGSFLPVRVTMSVVASSTVVSGGGDTGGGNTGGGNTGGGNTGGGDSGGNPTTALGGDVNGDGKVDETDVQVLKRAIAGQIPVEAAKMDISRDGVVNTRDLIDLIRYIRDQAMKSAQEQARSAVTPRPPASTTPAR